MGKTVHKNLSQFIEAVNRDADEECEKIKSQAEYEKNEKMALFSKELDLNIQNKIEYEIKKLRGESNKQMAELENRMKLELVQKRTQIEKDVFSKVEKKIKEFVKSDSYKDFILKSASEIGKLLKGDNLMIFVRDDDLIFESEIKNAVGKDCKIEVSEEIVLGGLKASTDLQTADDTLEKRLENEHEWFINNSKLSIV